MGSPDSEQDRSSDEGPQHKVTLTKPFYIGKYEVTQGQWQAVMGSNPSKDYGMGYNYPVYYVTWDDSQKFIQKLNALGQGTFRMPTEAEWEYACRAGTKTRFYWGDDLSYTQIGEYAWYMDNSSLKTHEVGLKKPNAFGLYDMSGNMWEWCQDWYSAYLLNDQTDPSSVNGGTYRVLRGGCWYYNGGDWDCRSAIRNNNCVTNDWTYNCFGLRLVSSDDSQLTPLPTPVQTPTPVPIPSSLPSITVSLPNLPTDAKPLEMVLIQPGTFMMGSAAGGEKDRQANEGPKHRVTITRPFYMGKYEVTQEQWQTVMGNNPSYYNGINLPVEKTSWDNCQTFIQKLNQLGQGIFRLPTEAEWEYACRAGTTARFYWGDDLNETQIYEYAWYDGNSSLKTHGEGLKKPNSWGLYDMSGNVFEWCQDWLGTFTSNAQNDPVGPNSGSHHVFKGGACQDPAGSCRPACRVGGTPNYTNSNLGFRLVRPLDSQVTPSPTPVPSRTSTPEANNTPASSSDWIKGNLEFPLKGKNGDTILGLGLINGDQPMSFSHDGRYLSVCSNMGVYIFDTESGEPKRRFAADNAGDWNLGSVFTSDNRNLITAERSGFSVWDISNGNRLKHITTNVQINSVAISKDGNQLLAGGANRFVQSYSLIDNKWDRTFSGYPEGAGHVEYSSDGKWILASGFNNDDGDKQSNVVAVVWDIETGGLVRSVTDDSTRYPCAIFSYNGKEIISGSWDGNVKFTDIITGTVTRVIPVTNNKIFSLAISLDGMYLGVGSESNAYLINYQSGNMLNSFQNDSWFRYKIAISPDKKYVSFASNGHQSKLYMINTWNELHTFKFNDSSDRIFFDKNDKNRILAIGDAYQIVKYKINSGIELSHFGGNRCVNGDLSIDGTRLLTIQYDGSLKYWDVQNENLLWTLNDFVNKTNTWTDTNIKFINNGETCVICDGTGFVTIFDLINNQIVKNLENTGYTFPIRSMANSKKGNYIILASKNSMDMYDTITFKKVLTFKGHQDYITGITFADDDNVIYSVGLDKKIIKWDTKTGQILKAYTNPNSKLNCIAISDDEKFIFAGGESNFLVYDITVDKIKYFNEMTFGIGACDFSSDNTYIAASEYNGVIHVWNFADLINPPIAPTVTATAITTKIPTATANPTPTITPNYPSLIVPASVTGEIQIARISNIYRVEVQKDVPYTITVRLGTLKDSILQIKDLNNVLIVENDDGEGMGFGSKIIWSPKEQGTYYIMVNSAGDTKGTYTLEITAPYTMPITGKSGETILGNGSLLDAVVSPGNKFIASCGGRGTFIWDFETGQLLRFLDGHTAWVNALKFSPDGNYLYTAGDQRILKWDMKTFTITQIFTGHTNWVTCLDISNDGAMLASGGYDLYARIWDTTNGKQLKAIKAHTDNINTLSFSPDRKRLLSGSSDKSAKLWDISTGNLLESFEDNAGWVLSTAFSPDNNLMVYGEKNSIKIINTNDYKILKTLLRNDKWPFSITFTKNNKNILIGYWGLDAELYSLANDQIVHTYKVDNKSYSQITKFSPDEKYVLTTSSRSQMNIWDASTESLAKRIDQHSSEILSLNYSPDDNNLYSGHYDRTIRLWNIKTGTLLKKFEQENERVNGLSLTNDGKLLLTGGEGENSVYLWNTESGELINKYSSTSLKNSISLAVSSDNQYFAAGTADKYLGLYELYTGKNVRLFPGHTDRINGVCFSPDGKYLISCSSDTAIKVWNIEEHKLLFTLEGHTGQVNSVSVSKDGRYLVSGSSDKSIRLWNMEDGKQIKIFRIHDNSVKKVNFSPDGNYVVSASDDWIAKIVEISTGKVLFSSTGGEKGHRGYLNCAIFSNDAKSISTGSSDGTVRIWDVSSAMTVQVPTATLVYTPTATPAAIITPAFTYTLSNTAIATFTKTIISTPAGTPSPVPVLFDIPENTIVVTDDLQSKEDLQGKFDVDLSDHKVLAIRWNFKNPAFASYHIYVKKDNEKAEFLVAMPIESSYYEWCNPEFGHSYFFMIYGLADNVNPLLLEGTGSVYYIAMGDNTPTSMAMNTPVPSNIPATVMPTPTYTLTPLIINTPTAINTMTFTPTFTITPVPVDTPKPSKDDVLTLVIISKNRLNELYGSGRVAVLMEKIEKLVVHETVRGEILDLDQYSSLRDKFKAWDMDSNNLALGTQTDPRENVKKANALAEVIKGIVGSKRAETKFTNVKYAVIIGSDAVIPFYRSKNPSRTMSSEFNYYKTLDPTHPLAAVLSQENVLSDDFYVNAAPSWMNKESDLELYLPIDLMIGRLVETPEEMGSMIDAYLALNGQNDFNKALVAGSDTYTNGADMAVNILQSDLGRVNQLSPDGDDPYELGDALKSNNPLNVLGLHGAHSKIFRTKKTSPLSAKAAKNYIQAMRGAVVMNWGGHGGLNLDRRLIDPTKEYENLSSVFCNMGVGAYLGTTAFAGSSQKSIGFSELLGLRFIDALICGTNSVTIGEAYNKAKQEYWLNESNGLAKSSIDIQGIIQNVADDNKVLSGMVLYGLPMFRVTSSNAGKVTPLSQSKEWENSLGMRMAKVKPKAIGKGLFEVQLKGTLENTFMKENTTDAGKYYSFNGVTQTNVNEPVQPRISFFTGAESFFPKGAVLESAKYETLQNFDPVIEGGEWGLDTIGEGQFNKKGFFPAIPFAVNTIAKSENVPPLQKFIFIAGQYNNDSKTERLYRELRYTTYYTGEPTDNTTPTINEPAINIGKQAKVTVQGWDKDGDPLYRAVLIWTDGQGQWKAIDLDQSQTNPKEWTAEFTVKPEMVFFLQAVDTLGNVAYLDNNGQYYPVKASQQEPKWNYVDFTSMLKLPVDGFASADFQTVSIPTDNAFDGATDGQGLKVIMQPGQGALLLASAPVSAGNGLVELKTSVRTASNQIQLGLVAIAVPETGPDGSLGYVNPTGNEVPVNKWGEMDLVYDSPVKNYYPAIQFVLPKEASASQTVYFDNLRYSDFVSKAGNPVAMAFDTAFDTINSNLDSLNPYIFLDPSFNKGAIALTAGQSKQGVSFTLVPNVFNQVSRIGGFFSAPPQIPSLIEASLFVKKESADDDGMFALAILDGEQTIAYYIKANHLPLNQFKQIRVGGNFSDPGQLVGPVVVIQHANTTGKAGKITFDDLNVNWK